MDRVRGGHFAFQKLYWEKKPLTAKKGRKRLGAAAEGRDGRTVGGGEGLPLGERDAALSGGNDMTRGKLRNIAASLRQRLMNRAGEMREDFTLVLTRYVLERRLYCLAQSPHRSRFVLKGAMLFQIWSGQIHRPTGDLDLLGRGAPSPPGGLWQAAAD